jgi:hypothetical protein
MEVPVLFPTFSKVTTLSLLSFSHLFATSTHTPPYARTADDIFYNEIITSGRQSIPGNSNESDSGDTSPVDLFTKQGFILWDYLLEVHNDADCVEHFSNLTELCILRNIQKVIIFIPSPSLPGGSTKFEFFQNNSSLPQNFVSMTNDLVNQMRALPNSTNFEVSIFFEPGFFASNVTEAPPYASGYSETTPTPPPLPEVALPGFYDDLPNMLNWAAAMIAQVPGIVEIAYDPEGEGTDGTTANKNNQQDVFNFSDYFKYAHGLVYTPAGSSTAVPIKLGTSPGIDESKIILANLSTFPVNSVYTAAYKSGVFPNPEPSWRLSNETDPLLQSVYVQAYQSNIPNIFNTATTNGNHNFTLSGQRFNKLLKDEPYLTGTGVISCQKGNPIVTGSHGSNFETFKGSDGFFFETQAPYKKIGIVGTVDSNTQITFSYGPTVDLPKAKYLRNEIVTGWPSQPDITQEMINNIYWMFSVNYAPNPNPLLSLEFFGNWILSDFMNFINALNTANASNPPFPGFNFPTTNYAIYNFDFLRSTVNTTPTIAWDVYPPSS